MKMDKKELLIITARRGYPFAAFKKSGYNVCHPYRERNMVERIMREVWFRLRLPQKVWFRKINQSVANIIVQDPLITRQYLLWLKEKFPDSKIRFMYQNMVGKAKHLMPKDVPNGIDIWTYDGHDSEKYGLKLLNSGGYYDCLIGERKKRVYDVFFVGADKGRGEWLLELQAQMEKLNLKTKFIICPDGKFVKKKSFYSKPISYTEVVNYVTMSKSILNVTLPDQIGATMRDYESIFNETKLITTNKNIKNYDFYIENNVFILGERNLAELPRFLNTVFSPVPKKILERHTLDTQMQEILSQ